MRLAAAIIATTTLLAAQTGAQARQLVPPPPSVAIAPASTEAEAANDAAAAEAIANLPKVTTKAKWLSGGEADYPEAERLAGHHGEVLVTGVLGVDGRLRFAMLKKSSGAPVLDRIAVTSALSAVFEPARDADGKPLAVPITVPQEFYAYKSSKPGGGLVGYSCKQFAADQDWWRATFPTAKGSDHELYAMMLGLGMLAGGNISALNAATLKANLADFDKRWVKAIDTCRAKPDKRFVEVLQPEGRLAEAMAKARR